MGHMCKNLEDNENNNQRYAKQSKTHLSGMIVGFPGSENLQIQNKNDMF